MLLKTIFYCFWYLQTSIHFFRGLFFLVMGLFFLIGGFYYSFRPEVPHEPESLTLKQAIKAVNGESPRYIHLDAEPDTSLRMYRTGNLEPYWGKCPPDQIIEIDPLESAPEELADLVGCRVSFDMKNMDPGRLASVFKHVTEYQDGSSATSRREILGLKKGADRWFLASDYIRDTAEPHSIWPPINRYTGLVVQDNDFVQRLVRNGYRETNYYWTRSYRPGFLIAPDTKLDKEGQAHFTKYYWTPVQEGDNAIFVEFEEGKEGELANGIAGIWKTFSVNEPKAGEFRSFAILTGQPLPARFAILDTTITVEEFNRKEEGAGHFFILIGLFGAAAGLLMLVLYIKWPRLLITAWSKAGDDLEKLMTQPGEEQTKKPKNTNSMKIGSETPGFAKNKLHAKAEYFLKRKKNIDPGDREWSTLVVESARLGQTDILMMLIDSCRKNFKQVPQNTIDTNALYDNVRISCEKVCEKLAIFSLFQDDETGGGLLGTAAEECKIDTLRVLIALGYNVKAQNIYSNTPLHNAAKAGCLEAIDILIANGADPNAQNRDGRTPLMDAVWLGQTKAVSSLVAHGADPEIKTDNGQTVLSMMSSSLADDAVLNEMLIAVGVESHKLLNIGGMPLISAAKQGDVELVRTLLDEGLDVNGVNDNGRTALMEAAWLARDIKVISLLMARSADINAVDKAGDTALTLAVASNNNNVKVVNEILKLGADVSIRTAYGKGMTALEIADSLWRPAMAAAINSFTSADPELVKISSLVAAIMEGDVSRVKSLLGGVSAEMLTAELGTLERQNRVLLKAAYKGMVEVVEMLLDGGAEINGFDGDRNTGLNFAARGNRISVAKLLLQRGCDVNLATDRNYTPIDWATTDEMIQLLRKHGGKSFRDR
jgi:uncharacterized protein